MFNRQFWSFFVLLYLISLVLGQLNKDDPGVCTDLEKEKENKNYCQANYFRYSGGVEECYKEFSSSALKCCKDGFEEVDGRCTRKSNGLLRSLISIRNKMSFIDLVWSGCKSYKESSAHLLVS